MYCRGNCRAAEVYSRRCNLRATLDPVLDSDDWQIAEGAATSEEYFAVGLAAF
jgi:hypothetical protein